MEYSKSNSIKIGASYIANSFDRNRFANTQVMEGLNLEVIVSRIEKFASPSLAGSWDNVGLLIEPQAPMKIRKVMLTNDLTEAVMKECIQKECDMILSYHPPIFKGLKRLTLGGGKWKERIVIDCLVNKIALYSPHTAFDAVEGGVNDWLLKPFGQGDVKPLEEVQPGIGPGRFITLTNQVSLEDAVNMLKQHLKLPHVRLAAAAANDTLSGAKMVSTIAVCAGSGGSLLKNHKADLWISGEMSHHEVLDAIHDGTSVILCEHSNTERGYLKEVFRDKLFELLDGHVKVEVSELDHDPLCIV